MVLWCGQTLGLAVDPDSTPTEVILWLQHSDGSQGNGDANSGVISKLTLFTNGCTVTGKSSTDVIVGLQRAIANHAPNSINFGPDGRLYMAIGGTTGGGASNDGTSEFGPRPEQDLTGEELCFANHVRCKRGMTNDL